MHLTHPQLESACFQPLKLLKCDILVSKFAFKFKLYRYYTEGYFDTHNIERLYVQKRAERAFFTHPDAGPVMKELHDSGRAGIGALVSRLEMEYAVYLYSTWWGCAS
jgi:hypothetical protein